MVYIKEGRMLKQFLSLVDKKITIQTLLDNNEVVLGDTISGYIQIKGGNYDQEIKSIQLEFFTKIPLPFSNQMKDQLLATFDITAGFTVPANKIQEHPFSFDIPFHFPVNIADNQTQIQVKTTVSTESFMTAVDEHFITIAPPAIFKLTIDAIQALNFRLNEVDLEIMHEALHPLSLDFKQEFEFKPVSPIEELKYLEEIEVFFIIQEGIAHIYVEAEEKTTGFLGSVANSTNMNEVIRVIRLPTDFTDVAKLTRDLKTMLIKEKIDSAYA